VTKYSFHPEAETEFNETIDRYKEHRRGLGHEFAIEVYSTIERILLYPNAWTMIDDGVRRSLVRRFPYGVLYSEESDSIFVLAVMHLHRDPNYWKQRRPTE
jgi:plasmid stabilization system protein ParE